jgi:hypothetical protein
VQQSEVIERQEVDWSFGRQREAWSFKSFLAPAPPNSTAHQQHSQISASVPLHLRIFVGDEDGLNKYLPFKRLS